MGAMPFGGRILSGVSVLAAVVEGGNFVKAAELIGITDSGVSRAISRLETRLGVRLLDRTTRSVTLTDEGRRFYEEVKPHLNAMEDAAVVASDAASAVRGRLKVDIDPFFPPLVLAGHLGTLCERYPELAIEFVTSEHVGDLVSDGIDLAIRRIARFDQAERARLDVPVGHGSQQTGQAQHALFLHMAATRAWRDPDRDQSRSAPDLEDARGQGRALEGDPRSDPEPCPPGRELE